VRRVRREDLEVDDIAPARDPLLERLDVVAFHELKAATEVGLDPAVDVAQALGKHPALAPHSPVDGLRPLPRELLDNHEEHGPSYLQL
jgi:hypothetical protein